MARFLFLQGPLSTFYSDIAASLHAEGHEVVKIQLCGNDINDWQHSGALNYQGRIEDFEDYLEASFTKPDFKSILLHGDRRPYHVAAIRWAKRHGIQIAVTELGYLRPDWMTIEEDAVSARSHFPSDPKEIRTIAEQCPIPDWAPQFKDKESKRILQELRFSFLNLAYKWRFPNYQSHRPHHPLEVYSGWLKRKLSQKKRENESIALFQSLIDQKQTFFVFGLQLSGDFQLRDHSPFKDNREVFEFVFRSFANHAPKDTILVIKPHPLEYQMHDILSALQTAAQKFNLKDRIKLIDGMSVGQLTKESLGFLSVNSSAGMESLGIQASTFCVMPTIYDVAGLTHAGTIDTFWTNAKIPDQGLFEALKQAIAGTIQVRGTIYNDDGRMAAAEAIASRLVQKNLSTLISRKVKLRRLEKARVMGVYYD